MTDDKYTRIVVSAITDLRARNLYNYKLRSDVT